MLDPNTVCRLPRKSVKMKTFVLVAVCAIFSQCHCQEPRPRSKRTLRMLESLFGSMRDTFAPLAAPALPPAQPPPPPLLPPEVIVATKYPVGGVKYALYPTVRMHIRPLQQHVIYMQAIPAIPAMPATVLRPARRPPNAAGNVELVRHVQPMMRLPKSKTTTTIHYEIIPLPVPVQSAAAAAAAAEPPPPPPPPLPSSPTVHEEDGDPPPIPWSFDELPPPVPTSSFDANPADEPNVPWNIHALPPPIATKQPRGRNEPSGWPARPVHPNLGTAYVIPMLGKKLMIPAQDHRLQNGHRSVFRPSQLQSEIIVQPSVEVAAYSETQTLAQQPTDYVDRFRRLNNPRPQVFPNHNNRPRRDTSSMAAPHLVGCNHQLADVSPSGAPLTAFHLPSAPLPAKRPTTSADDEKLANKSALPQPQPFRTATNTKSYADATHSASDLKPFLSNYALPKDGSNMKFGSPLRYVSELPSGTTTPEHYVLITPRPVNYTRRLVTDPFRAESEPAKEYSSLPKTESQQLDILGTATYNDERTHPQQRLTPDFFEFSSKGSESLQFPPTGLLSKWPPRQQHSQSSIFSGTKSPLSVDHLFDEQPSTRPPATGASHIDDFLRSDYDNVEYFEPIVIDIDKPKPKQKDDFGPKLQFKYKHFEAKQRAREPLRLPHNLHETIDTLQEALMHPPIFDMEGEANEPQQLVIVVSNEIT